MVSNSRPTRSISKRLKRMARVEEDDDDGFAALNEELLLDVFASYLDMGDVLRSADTCKRWRRLIAAEAVFISSGRLVNAATPAVGFFHTSSMAPLEFLPATFSRRASVFDADLLRNSRLMASRNDRLLLELRGAAGALRLAVCNAMTDGVFALPSLPDDVRWPEHYACALVAATDLHGVAAVHPLLLRSGSAAAYLVIILYMRGGAMICRSCSSDTNAWGAEGHVSHANIRSRQLGEMDGGGVAVGGSVFWLSGNKVVFGLRLDTMQGRVESPKWYGMHRFSFGHPYPDRRLVALPDLQLGTVQVGRGDDGRFVIDILSRNDFPGRSRWWGVRRWDWETLDLQAIKSMRLRAVSERSGLIILAATHGDGGQQDMALYALDLAKKEVHLMPVRPRSCCFRRSSCTFYGCDMDLAGLPHPAITSLCHPLAVLVKKRMRELHRDNSYNILNNV